MSHLQEAGNVAAQEGGLPPLEVRGVDVSSLVEVEGLGAAFYTDQERTDLMSFMAAQGVNLVRLRLWVDPRDEAGDGYLGGGNDLSTDLELARRAVECGMDVMIDLHYSDFWTDPKKQQPPKAWSGYSLDEMTSVPSWRWESSPVGSRLGTRSRMACCGLWEPYPAMTTGCGSGPVRRGRRKARLLMPWPSFSEPGPR